jgi:hypothetical protein
MDAIDLLKRQAVTKRDKAILDARREYRTAIQEIRALARRLGIERRGRRRQAGYDRLIAGGDDSCHGMTVVASAELILLEGRPLTMIELAIEVQRRGCRSRDDSRAVAKAIRNGFAYHRKRFRRDRNGRWSVIHERTRPNAG